MKKILFILSIYSLIFQLQAQTINMAISHNPSKEPVCYVVDFLHIERAQLLSIGFQRKDIKSTKTEGSTIIVTTRLLVVLDGKMLLNRKDKKEKLSTIKKECIESIVKINREKAIELYGKKGKNGALQIKTRST